MFINSILAIYSVNAHLYFHCNSICKTIGLLSLRKLIYLLILLFFTPHSSIAAPDACLGGSIFVDHFFALNACQQHESIICGPPPIGVPCPESCSFRFNDVCDTPGIMGTACVTADIGSNGNTDLQDRCFFYGVTACSSLQVINQQTGLCEEPNTINVAKVAGNCKADQALLIGNPVHPATGNKFQAENDISSSNLSFTRYFNSIPDLNIGLGQNWSADYFQTLILASPLTVVIREDGQQLTFNCPSNASGNCLKDLDIRLELDKTSTGFALTTEDDVIEIYDTEGKLLSITPRSGETQTLSYNPTTNFLETVTDAYGRTLTFTYDADERLDTVTDPDGEVYTYAYDNNNNLTSVTFPDDTPGNTNDNTSKQYQYNDINFPNHLTEIIDENGNTFASFGYDTQGRAIFSEHDGGAQRVDLTYNVDGTTTVTDSLGASNTYSYDVSFGVPRTSGVTGGQCGSGCTNEGQAQTYDTNGYLASRTDFEGNLTTFTNNARGLQESRTEAVGTPEQRIIATEWHPTFRLPTKITEPGKETIFTYDSQGRLLSRTEREI